jgi:hypothetical protein
MVLPNSDGMFGEWEYSERNVTDKSVGGGIWPKLVRNARLWFETLARGLPWGQLGATGTAFAATLAASLILAVHGDAAHTLQRFAAEWSPVGVVADWRAGVPKGADGRTAWMRLTFAATPEEVDSAALVLGGPFSARVYVNGVHIGDKGAPLESDANGPIDAALPLRGAARVGENELLMYISASAFAAHSGEIIQTLDIAPEGASAGRSLGQYAVAVSQLALMLVIAAALMFWSVKRREDAWLRWAGWAGVCLVVAFFIETLRVWWNYPVSFHVVRMACLGAALFAFGAATHGAILERLSRRRPWADILGAALAVAVCGFQGFGVDNAMAALFVGLATLSVGVCWRRSTPPSGALALILFATVALALWGPRQFVDNGVYLLGTLTLATFAWRDRAFESDTAKPKASSYDTPLPEIVWAKADGNYVNVRTADGRTQFMRLSLSHIPVSNDVVRVHRSYLVNLLFVRRMSAQTGSKYVLELADGTGIPVSRNLARSLRQRLRQRELSKPEGEVVNPG